MQYVFWATFLAYVIISLRNIFLKKIRYSSATYILLGVCIPLVLYSFRWSELITEAPTDDFYILFIYLFLAGIFAQIINNGEVNCPSEIIITRGRGFITLINLVWIASLLMENYVTTGYLFPSLLGIDGHAQQASGLLYITRASYAFVALDLVYFFSTKEKYYFSLSLIPILLPILSTSSRMQAVETLLEGLSFFLFLWGNGYSIKNPNKLRNTILVWKGKPIIDESKRGRFGIIQKVILAIIIGVLVYVLVMVGIDRMTHYGIYSVLYSDGIKYTGPFGEVGAWIYGYFALSFNNLNRSILTNRAVPNYIGIYSFNSLFFGILQFDNLFGMKSNAAQSASNWVVHAATVPTGFWSFYYDYKLLCFIPIVWAFIRERIIKYFSVRSKRGLIWTVIYFYCIPQWFFMSFTNTIFDVTGLTTAIIIIILFYLCTGTNNS